jgi:hypothetical protein
MPPLPYCSLLELCLAYLPVRARDLALELLHFLIKVALMPPPPPKCWIFPVFHEKEPLLFLGWVVLVRHFLLLKGILVQDSFVEKAPNVRSVVKYVRKICYTWN